jgi:hypothetical protein
MDSLVLWGGWMLAAAQQKGNAPAQHQIDAGNPFLDAANPTLLDISRRPPSPDLRFASSPIFMESA